MSRIEDHDQKTNKYSPEVRERAVRMVLDNQGQHESRLLCNRLSGNA